MKTTEPAEATKNSTLSQNAQLMAFILSGKVWHCKMSAERQRMGIGYPAMRIGALRDMGVTFHQEEYTLKNENGNSTTVIKYSIDKENREAVKQHLQRNHRRFYGYVAFWLGE